MSSSDSETPGAELARLIGEATWALARLDAEELALLAARLQTLRPADVRASLPKLQASMRVFAAVLSATSENVSSLERSQKRGVDAATGYADDVCGSDWTHGLRATAPDPRAGRMA